MVAFSDYAGREQSYVKHVFLENYLELLVHKIARLIRTLSMLMDLPAPGKAPTSALKIRPSALH